MEVTNRSIYLHPFELMSRLKDHIVSFDAQKETINAVVEVEANGEKKKVGVFIERINEPDISNSWSARAVILSEGDGVFELKAVRAVSDLLAGK